MGYPPGPCPFSAGGLIYKLWYVPEGDCFPSKARKEKGLLQNFNHWNHWVRVGRDSVTCIICPPGPRWGAFFCTCPLSACWAPRGQTSELFLSLVFSPELFLFPLAPCDLIHFYSTCGYLLFARHLGRWTKTQLLVSDCSHHLAGGRYVSIVDIWKVGKWLVNSLYHRNSTTLTWVFIVVFACMSCFYILKQ